MTKVSVSIKTKLTLIDLAKGGSPRAASPYPLRAFEQVTSRCIKYVWCVLSSGCILSLVFSTMKTQL